MFLNLFQNKEKLFSVYYIIIFFFIFVIFNIKFVTEEVCIFICFFGILNLLANSLIKYARQELNFKWQKTILWFFSKFSFLFLLAFVANTTTSIKNFFNFYFFNFFNFIQNNKIFSVLSLIKLSKITNKRVLFNFKGYNKYLFSYIFS